MPTPTFTAADVMDSVAALMNDAAKQKFTYVAQLPYLKIAVRELREFMALANIPVTNESATVLTIPTNTTTIGYGTTPALPADLMQIQALWTSMAGLNGWSALLRKDFLPSYASGVTNNQPMAWAWMGNEIRITPSNQAIDIKLDYIKQLLMVVDQNSVFDIVNGQSFLEYRTAGLVADYIGENQTRAEQLNSNASNALDRATGIETKARQGMFIRKRPFRSAWKSRG